MKPVKQEFEWLITTFDNKEYVFTDEEYQFYKLAIQKDIKVLFFKEISIAVSDIRRAEKRAIKVRTEWELDEKS